MGLFSGISNFLSGGARDEAAAGYDEANRMIQPYRKGGLADYQAYRDYVNQNQQTLAPYQGAGANQWAILNQSAPDYYNQIMQGYAESPQARYEREQALRASNAGGAASGMLGSGAQLKALQENAADVSARDQQRYFGNVLGANQAQMGALANLQGRQDQQSAMMQYLTSLGYGGAQMGGQNAINRGLSNASYDAQVVPTLGGLVTGGLTNYKANDLYNQTPDAAGQIPWYLMFA